MSPNSEKYDFSTKEAQYLLKTFSGKLYEILEYLEKKDKLIEEQSLELASLTNAINILKEDNDKLNTQVLQLAQINKVSLIEKILRKGYRITRKIALKTYQIIKNVFRKRD